jgi:hypothetical protein
MREPIMVIAPKQTPVINRLHETMNQALAYASAIRDNAQDDGQPIPSGVGSVIPRDVPVPRQHPCRSR